MPTPEAQAPEGPAPRPPRAAARRLVRSYVQMVLGAAVQGLGVSALIVPARLADGGLTGVAITLHYLTGLGVGPLYFALNLPLLAWAWRDQGPRFVWRTLLGVALTSAATAAFAGLRLPVQDRLLSALYGGLAVGLGIGLILRAGGSTGGADVVARHLYLRYGVSYTQTYLAIDFAVLAAVALWLGLPAAMYAWVATAVAGRVVTYVVEGPRRGNLAIVVTQREQALLRRITGELARGATRLVGTGAFTGQSRPLLLVAVGGHEVARLRQIVASEDPRAFVVVLPAAEVLGEGFFALHEADPGA
jgi:uncharacterized membrane-anchored protein YitT (DUF2179 family)